MHGLSGLVKTKDHWLWLVCTRVWTESGEEDFHGVWSLTGGLFYGPPCMDQCKSDWPPTKHKTAPKRRDGNHAVKMVTWQPEDCGCFEMVNLFLQNLRDLHLLLQKVYCRTPKKIGSWHQIFWKSLLPVVQLEILHLKLF